MSSSGDCDHAHDHGHGHKHDEAKKEEAHSHDHGHDHSHKKEESHAHDHGHGHKHDDDKKGSDCTHDHDHGHGHGHSHKKEESHAHDHGHGHKHDEDKKGSDCTHDHDHGHGHGHKHGEDEQDAKKAKHDHNHDDHSHDHGHSHTHVHGEDCDECGPKVTTEEDVKNETIPDWKKKALEQKLDASANPLGLSWNVETKDNADDVKKGTSHDYAHDHGHTHEHMEHPGHFSERPSKARRDYDERAFTVGLGGPVGSGKTALMLALCKELRDRVSLGAVTNDIFTREDGEFLTRNEALPKERIRAVETGGCPHAAIREDISANLHACEVLTASFSPLDIILLESGGDNLAANYSPELADFTIYVIDVAGGDKVPRKGGPGVTQSDVLVVNKTDLAEAVGASIDVMKRDSKKMRGDGPTVFAQCRPNKSTGKTVNVDVIIDHILGAWKSKTA